MSNSPQTQPPDSEPAIAIGTTGVFLACWALALLFKWSLIDL